MTNILLTGFTPFAGRDVNASWIAASLLQQHLGCADVASIEIPVEWGKPEKILDRAIRKFRPEIIISMGEGKRGCFQLETLALNLRARKQDNKDGYPPAAKVALAGPPSIKSSAPVFEIRRQLVSRGVPVLLSLNAGRFLCEETLFVLEHNCKRHAEVKLVLFVHVPPYGTSLKFKNQDRICDHELLLEFSRDLFEAVTLHLQSG